MLQFFVGMLMVLGSVGNLEASGPMTPLMVVVTFVTILVGLFLAYIGTQKQ